MFKVGDQVALIGSPNKLYGTITRVVGNRADINHVDADGRKWSAARRADNGHVLSGTWASMQIVPYVDTTPPPPSAPKIMVITPTGAPVVGDKVVEEGDGVRLEVPGGSIPLLTGDVVYKRVGRIEKKVITEEYVPIEPGYRYLVADFTGGHEVEVVAIRGDYAFIQQFNSEGVAQGCTTTRVRNIPKEKRPCNKLVKQLTKE